MIYTIILLILSFSFCQVVTDNSFNSSKSIALAGATVSNPGTLESVFYNPANLASTRRASFLIGRTIFYEQDFLEHKYYSVQYHPTKKTNLALTVQELSTKTKGNNQPQEFLSSEKAITISQGFSLLKDRNSKLQLGYNINYFILSQGRSAGTEGDGSNGLPAKTMTSVGLDIGVLASLRDKIIIGAFIKNINSPSIGKSMGSHQYLPRRMNIGFSYLPIKSLITSFCYERVITQKTNQFRFGVEYELHRFFTLRAGVQMKPNKIGFGFITSVNDYSSFSYGLITDPILPLTHNVEVGLKF